MKSLTTGMTYEFIVTTENADGTNKKMTSVKLIALNIADAWLRIGAWAHRYMKSPEGSKITSIELS